MPKNHHYLFLLGNTPTLSLAEIKASVDPLANLVNPQVAQAKTSQTATALMGRLGGTIKILQPLTSLDINLDEPTLVQTISQTLLKQATEKKLSFYVAQIGRSSQPRVDLQLIKSRLKALGLNSRFSPGKRTGLSAAKLLHQQVVELNLVYNDNIIYLAKTVAVQDIDSWIRRDRKRPYTQRQAGMLPLKVARMMVNLAVRQDPLAKKRLLDPFCGSGSILMEAAMIGVPTVIASDNHPQAARGAKANLNWLKSEFKLNFNFETYQKDATKLTLETGKINYLVSEPFLGKQTPDRKKIKHIYLGLQKLYLGSFKNWTKLLGLGARLVVVFPSWPDFNQLNFETLIDKLGSLGYTTSSEPIIYGRNQAQVIRKIWQFEFKG